MHRIQKLLDIMAALRNPETGCPWDIKQNFSTIAPYTIEEAYEVADAITRNDMRALQEELGDLLFQVVFHSQMAKEADAFEFEDVAASVSSKMLRRHPHVFDELDITDDEELRERWEAQKAEERSIKPGDSSILSDIAIALPALLRAEKLQKRAARAGFDWPDSNGVKSKIFEELEEIEQARTDAEIHEEIGDLLFSVVNLARHYKVDAETALRDANTKFERRFRMVERLAQNESTSVQNLDLDELESLWQVAKQTVISEA